MEEATAWEVMGWSVANAAPQWLLVVLPVSVAIALVLARMILATTARKLQDKRRREAREPYGGDLTPALELQEQYREAARAQLMQEIRQGRRQAPPRAAVKRFFNENPGAQRFPEERGKELESLVAGIRLFQFLDADIVSAVAAGALVRRTRKGEILFGREADGTRVVPRTLQLTVKGRVEIRVAPTPAKGEARAPAEHSELLSVVEEGQTVTSMISMLEAITAAIALVAIRTASDEERPAAARRLKLMKEQQEKEEEEEATATALEDGILLEVPLALFETFQAEYPEAITRLARMIVLRLQRVTLLTVNQHFGLSKELVMTSGRRLPLPPQPRRTGLTEEQLLNEAFETSVASLAKLLGVSRDASCVQLLRQHLQVEQHSPGSIVMAQVTDPRALEESQHARDASEPCLYFIVRGALDVYLAHQTSNGARASSGESLGEEELLYTAATGDTVGQLAVVTGDFYYRVETRVEERARADSVTVLGKLRKDAFDALVAKRPTVIGRAIYMIYLQLAPVVKYVDYALDWQQRQAGEVVCRQDDDTDGMYVVLSGRLRAFGPSSASGGHAHDAVKPHRPEAVAQAMKSKAGVAGGKDAGKERSVPLAHHPLESGGFGGGGLAGLSSLSVPGGMSLFGVNNNRQGNAVVVAEYGKGESFGALEVLTDMPRASTVVAVRDTELAKISSTMFKFVIKKYPQVVVQFSKIVGATMQKQLRQLSLQEGERGAKGNISTVAVVGVSEEVPVAAFSQRLAKELDRIVPTLRLDKTTPQRRFGKSNLTAAEEAKLTSWLGEMEEKYNIVLYECELNVTTWTKRCLRQADLILIVGWAKGDFCISEVERYLLRKQTSARKELVLLHPVEDKQRPARTFEWVQLRQGWCSAWHHASFKLQVPRTVRMKRAQEWHSSSFLRRMPGTGDGGISGLIKRGAGNMWKRIKSEAVRPTAGQAPKDDVARLARLVTGTAVGLVLGGGGARGLSHVGVIKALEEAGIPIDMVGGTSMGSFVGSLYARDPEYIDLVKSVRASAKDLGNRWRQVLDVTYPRVSFLTGAAFNEIIQQACGEDSQIEDMWLNYFAITCNISHSRMIVHRHGSVWKYVRASMSLVGFLPPICDQDGSLLVDGGYVNNLPADVMRALGINTIIAVDVGSEVDTNYHNYGDHLSGWWLLWNKLNPFTTKVKIPNLGDIQSQLAYVSSVKLLEEVKRQPGCIYWRPPIAPYGTLDFHKFDEIHDVGYQYAKEEIDRWRRHGGKGAPFAWLATQKERRRGHKRTLSLERPEETRHRLSF